MAVGKRARGGRKILDSGDGNVKDNFCGWPMDYDQIPAQSVSISAELPAQGYPRSTYYPAWVHDFPSLHDVKAKAPYGPLPKISMA